jgi:hypothetical protein
MLLLARQTAQRERAQADNFLTHRHSARRGVLAEHGAERQISKLIGVEEC